MMHPHRTLQLTAVLTGVLLSTTAARAHDVDLTLVNVVFETDGAYRVDVHYDIDAWLVGVPPEHLTPADLDQYLASPPDAKSVREAELRAFIERRIKLRFDDKEAACEIEFPRSADPPAPNPHGAVSSTRFIRLTGRAPDTARQFVLFTSKTFGNIILTLRTGEMLPMIQRLDAGGRSEPYPLRAGDGTSAELTPPPPQSAWRVTAEFIALGFEHILPLGVDHIVFVLCLFLLSHKWSALIWQVTAFTIAHSITLSLAVLGVISLSEQAIARVVEPLIALSIAFVAVENLFTSKLHPWRPAVVFLFGLLHGLGFASVLLELGVPQGHYLNALISFNIGVEIGQIAVIAIAFAAVGWWRRAEWYRRRIVVPASCLIALIGGYWAVERFVGA